MFSKQAGQFLMKTPNFDKQAEKFLITPVKKLKNINVIDIFRHDVSYQLLRMNHKPVVQHCISVFLYFKC